MHSGRKASFALGIEFASTRVPVALRESEGPPVHAEAVWDLAIAAHLIDCTAPSERAEVCNLLQRPLLGREPYHIDGGEPDRFFGERLNGPLRFFLFWAHREDGSLTKELVKLRQGEIDFLGEVPPDPVKGTEEAAKHLDVFDLPPLANNFNMNVAGL